MRVIGGIVPASTSIKVTEARRDEIFELEDYGVYERGVHCYECSLNIGPHALIREEREFIEEHKGHGLSFRTFYNQPNYS